MMRDYFIFGRRQGEILFSDKNKGPWDGMITEKNRKLHGLICKRTGNIR
jgi:hypothetical protein